MDPALHREFATDLPDLQPTTDRLLAEPGRYRERGEPVLRRSGRHPAHQSSEAAHPHDPDLLAAAKSADVTAFQHAKTAWYANANLVAAFLHKANPKNWPMADLRDMMKTHLDLTLKEASDQLEGNYAASVADFDTVETEFLGMADMLSSGIIAQFPHEFALESKRNSWVRVPGTSFNRTPPRQGGHMARLFSIRPGIRLRGRKFLGVRGWAGKPTHPPLTDFPIVCYILAGTMDVVSYVAARGNPVHRPGPVARDFFFAGTIVIIAGAAISLATVTTGLFDWWKGLPRRRKGVLGRAHHTQVWRTVNWHMTVMLTVTAIVIADIAVRLSQFDRHASHLPTVLLSVLGAALVAYGATYGGELVFDFQFNVQPLEGSRVWDETEIDEFPGSKAESAAAADGE